MQVHFLDWIMWLFLCILLWKILEAVTDGEWTEDLGGILGVIVILVFTIVHIFLFGVLDWNWIDIFRSIGGRRELHINW